MSTQERSATGLILALPREAGEALPWWRYEDGILVESGLDVHPLDASLFDLSKTGQRVIALLPTGISRAEWTNAEAGLAIPQAEALAARAMAQGAIGDAQSVHAVARAVEFSEDTADRDDGSARNVRLLAVLVERARLSGGLAALADLGIDPTHVVPAALVAWRAAGDAMQGDAVVRLAGEEIFVGEALIMPADASLLGTLAPDAEPVTTAPEIVEAALADTLANPIIDMLTGPFARKRRIPRLQAGQWRTLGWLVGATIVATLLIGIVTIWRYHNAAEEADERALAAIEAKLGDQPDLGAAEAALDQQLARSGRGAAVLSVPMSALYQAMQPVPQVTVRQIGYVGDGTLSVSLAAPDAAPVNQILRALQDAGYRVTGDSRVDATGASVFDITVRGY